MSERCDDCKYKTELLNLSHETISKIAARAEIAERQVEKLNRTGAALPALFKIQEACPAAGIASGISVGVDIIVREYKAALLQVHELVAALQHMKNCGPCSEDSWETCEGGREALAAMAKATGKPIRDVKKEIEEYDAKYFPGAKCDVCGDRASIVLVEDGIQKNVPCPKCVEGK